MRIGPSPVVHDGAGPLEKLQQGLRFARQTLPIRALLLLLGLVSFILWIRCPRAL